MLSTIFTQFLFFSLQKIDFAALAGETYDDNEMAHASSEDLDEGYVNKHIRTLLSYNFVECTSNPSIPASSPTNNCEKIDTKDDKIVNKGGLQIITNGSILTAKNILDPNHPLTIHKPMLIKDTATSIGMKLPKKKKSESGENEEEKEYSIREIGKKIGMNHPITVMDVRSQEEIDGMIFADMVDYFEDEDRRYTSKQTSSPRQKSRKNNQRVLNQISLEFSNLQLAREVRSPQFVRDLDWIDNVWDQNRRKQKDYPRVQYYCLTSTAGCYTDFHVDFGGTSVYYHVLSGEKVFVLIPPTANNMMLYEKWLCRKDQNDIFFPDMKMTVDREGADSKTIGVEGGIRINLKPGQTFIIPTAWIHAVFTPVDSLVIGGNFLHGLDIKGQIDVNSMEIRVRVPAKFRFPSFVQMNFYACLEYFRRLLKSQVHKEEIDGLQYMLQACRGWHQKEDGDSNRIGSVMWVQHQIVGILNDLYGITSLDNFFIEMDHFLKRFRAGLETTMSDLTTVHPATSQTVKKSTIPKLKLSLKRKAPSNEIKTVNDKDGNKPEVKEESEAQASKPKLKLKLGTPLKSPLKETSIKKEENTQSTIETKTENANLQPLLFLEENEDNDDEDIPEISFNADKSENVSLIGSETRGNSTYLSSKGINVKDDEWMPDQEAEPEYVPFEYPKKKVQKRKVSTPTKRSQPAGKKLKGTSRSRLMKKFKF